MIGPSGFGQAPLMRDKFIEVYDDQGAVIHSLKVTGKSDKAIEVIERGMLRNMDRERFHIGTVER